MSFLANIFYAGITALIPFFGQLMARMYYRNMWVHMIFWIPIFWMPPFSFIPALFVLFGQFRRRKPMSTTTKILMAFFGLIIMVVVCLIGYYVWKNFFGSNTQSIVAEQLRNAADFADPNYNDYSEGYGDGSYGGNSYDSTSSFLYN